jgi:hypothetical protein
MRAQFLDDAEGDPLGEALHQPLVPHHGSVARQFELRGMHHLVGHGQQPLGPG